MNQYFDNELSAPLAAMVRSLDGVSDDAVETAQQRLITRLHGAGRRRVAPLRWAAVAAGVAALALVVLFVPMPRSGNAFAAVLEHFRQFDTLTMTVVQHFGGDVLQTSRTVVDARGVVRTDIGKQLSVIVDPNAGRLLTLVHAQKVATLTTIPKRDHALAQSLKWLDELRRYRGAATPLPGTRTIDGRTAHGWSLTVQSLTMEIWADADGLPLSMRQTGANGLQLDFRFTFNRPLAPGELSSAVPAGYKRVAPDSDD